MVSPSGQFADTPQSTPTATPQIQPRVYYFISRSNGSFVPVVPVDELPYSMRLAGLPRVIALEQTCGMQHIGMLPYTGQFFRLEDGTVPRQSTQTLQPATQLRSQSGTSTPTKFLAPDAFIRPGTSHGLNSPPARPVSAAATATNWRNPNPDPPAPSVDPTQAFIDKIVASNVDATARQGYPTPKPTPPLPNDPENKKKYCTYWLRTGNCDYQLTGCRYLHEMPDLPTLKEIGFRTVPRWWQEETAIRMGGSKVPTLTGKVVKSEEWLKRRDSAGSDADDESDADSAHDSKFDSDQSSSEADESRSKSSIKQKKIPTTRKQDPPPITIRKPSSTPSNDMLSFAPLIPTPSVSTPATSTSSSPAQSPQPLTRKVFVPAGESANYHIEQARKTADAKRQSLATHHVVDAHRHTAASLRCTELVPARPAKPTESVGTARPAPRGLLASKHAPCSPPITQRSASSATVVSTSTAESTQPQSRSPAASTPDSKRCQPKHLPRVEGRVRRAVGHPLPPAGGRKC